MEEKWRVVRSQTLLRDAWINLRADECVTPAGVTISPYCVLSYPDWVHVVALTEAGVLVLVRQYRHAAGAFFCELPGGAVDPRDGGLEQAARRELVEETGFTAPRWELISSSHPNPATHTNRIHFFLARDAVRERSPTLDEGEHGLSVVLLDIPDAMKRLRSGLLGHAMHASGLLLGLAAAGRLNLTEA